DETAAVCWNDRFDFDLFWRLIDQVLWNDPTVRCIVKCKPWEWEGLPRSKSLFYSNPDCGLPIGNLTSQVFSNVYLHEFDLFVKEELGVEYYGRYVDDFVLIHPDKRFLLDALKKIKTVLKERFLLDLHPDKIYLQHYTKGFLFLGAYIKPGRIYIGNRTKKTFRRIIKDIDDHLKTAPPSVQELRSMRATVNSYLGLMNHYRSYNIRKKILMHRERRLLLMKYGYLKVKPYSSMIFCLHDSVRSKELTESS
ncbi:MAG: RNA-directed DNA polymerase, partial [Dysgonamonadaceae bacterium]|nr:RNA-directed DNA polymerase [Dysgonamonadaceae bacterium]